MEKNTVYYFPEINRNGPRGKKGGTGNKGNKGPVGNQGVTGPIGDVGAKGDVGPRGVRGLKGDKGNIGTTGVAGQKGPVGDLYGVEYSKFFVQFGLNSINCADNLVVSVFTGATGCTGPTGSSGCTGSTGCSGPTGCTGATGCTGPTGSSGCTGSTGCSGPTGCTDATGCTGPTGSSGCTGSTGCSGPTGCISLNSYNLLPIKTYIYNDTDTDLTINYPNNIGFLNSIPCCECDTIQFNISQLSALGSKIYDSYSSRTLHLRIESYNPQTKTVTYSNWICIAENNKSIPLGQYLNTLTIFQGDIINIRYHFIGDENSSPIYFNSIDVSLNLKYPCKTV